MYKYTTANAYMELNFFEDRKLDLLILQNMERKGDCSRKTIKKRKQNTSLNLKIHLSEMHNTKG